jgi:hypothetical protein
MTSDGDHLPVLVIDGATFSDLDGFAREFSRLLCNYTWRGNLDAFNDLLRGGFGTPETGWVLRWLNSETSRAALGYQETARRLGAAPTRVPSLEPFDSRRQDPGRAPRRGPGPV